MFCRTSHESGSTPFQRGDTQGNKVHPEIVVTDYRSFVRIWPSGPRLIPGSPLRVLTMISVLDQEDMEKINFQGKGREKCLQKNG
jgi:hypothetical protein